MPKEKKPRIHNNKLQKPVRKRNSVNKENLVKNVELPADSDKLLAKSGRWSLGNDVSTASPLLDDMGLSLLDAEDDSRGPSPTPPSQVVEGPMNVLQPNENCCRRSYFTDNCITDDFFVFKRRRLEALGRDDKINRLVDEVMLEIFKWLPKFMLARCAQVCKRWKRLAFDESLWRRLNMGGKSLKPGVVGRVVLRGVSILRLANAEISSPLFCPQLQYLPGLHKVQSRLQYLDLSMAGIQPEALEELFSVCYDLQKLSLEQCTVNENVCIHIAKNINLETLNLTMCYGLSCKALKPVFENCKRCSDLMELDVSDATALTEKAVDMIITKLKKVEYLGFSRCYHIPMESYQNLIKLKNLMYLDLYGLISDSDLTVLRAALMNVQINKYLFSSAARPTVGIRRTSIWGLRVRD